MTKTRKEARSHLQKKTIRKVGRKERSNRLKSLLDRNSKWKEPSTSKNQYLDTVFRLLVSLVWERSVYWWKWTRTFLRTWRHTTSTLMKLRINAFSICQRSSGQRLKENKRLRMKSRSTMSISSRTKWLETLNNKRYVFMLFAACYIACQRIPPVRSVHHRKYPWSNKFHPERVWIKVENFNKASPSTL